MPEDSNSLDASDAAAITNVTESAQMDSPVFILGMHRSGTTILYEMLSELGHWQTLEAWQVVKYEQLAAGEDPEHLKAEFVHELEATGMQTRGVDAIKAGPQTKEEYCFILDNHGFDSRLTSRAFPLFEQLCRTARSTDQNHRPLLLKNPWDFGNAHVIRSLIPNARFVFIHRHPQQTINSMHRFLSQAFQQPNAWMMMLSQRYRAIVESRWKMRLLGSIVRRFPSAFVDGLTWWFGRQCDAYLSSIRQLPASARIEITYDQLCAQPNITMRRLQQFLIPSCPSTNQPRTQTRPAAAAAAASTSAAANVVAAQDIDFSTMISRRANRSDAVVAAKAKKIERRYARYLQRIAELEKEQDEADRTARPVDTAITS